MISVSVQDLLLRYFQPKRYVFGNKYPVYVFRDRGVVFYVGISHNPIRRFAQHTQKNSTSEVGHFILNHLPLSMAWQVEFWSLDDCLPFIPDAWRHDRRYTFSPQSIAERALIAHLRPCFNKDFNDYPSQIPSRYLQYSLPLNSIANDQGKKSTG